MKCAANLELRVGGDTLMGGSRDANEVSFGEDEDAAPAIDDDDPLRNESD